MKPIGMVIFGYPDNAANSELDILKLSPLTKSVFHAGEPDGQIIASNYENP